MRLSSIEGGSVRCKKCNDGTVATHLVHMAVANKDIPLCEKHAIEICTIYDLKVLQKVMKGDII